MGLQPNMVNAVIRRGERQIGEGNNIYAINVADLLRECTSHPGSDTSTYMLNQLCAW